MHALSIEKGVLENLHKILRDGAVLSGDQYLTTLRSGRRVQVLLQTSSISRSQDRLLLSAAVRELEGLRRTVIRGMTGEIVLPQEEEAAPVHVYLRSNALTYSLKRTLDETR